MRSLHVFSGLSLIFVLVGCSRAVTIKSVKATKTAVESTVATITSGTVTAQQEAVLGFSTTGRVARVAVKLGDKVVKGQILAELENSDLRTINAESRSALDRSEELFKAGLVSKAALDEARRAYEVARANFDRSVIRAPFAGMVSELNMQTGELAQAASTKAPIRLVDLQPRIIKGEIDETDLSKVKVGDAARIKILAVQSTPLKGVVTKVVPYVGTAREQDRSAPIELSFAEPSERVPVGASADIEIVVASKADALAVPSRCVLGAGQNRYTFVVRDGKLVKTPVKLGIGNYDRSEIIDGLSAGDTIAYPTEDVEFHDGQKVKVTAQTWP